jgi:hypothetical protein
LQSSHADPRPACELHTQHLWQSHADRDGHRYSYTDGHGDGHGHCHSYSHCYNYGNGDGNRYADGYWGTASNSVTAATANTGASPLGRQRKFKRR